MDGLDVIIDRETGELRMYTVFDEARSIISDVFEVALVLGILKEHENEANPVILRQLSEDKNEQKELIANVLEKFGSYQEALDKIDITDEEVSMVLKMNNRWQNK